MEKFSQKCLIYRNGRPLPRSAFVATQPKTHRISLVKAISDTRTISIELHIKRGGTCATRWTPLGRHRPRKEWEENTSRKGERIIEYKKHAERRDRLRGRSGEKKREKKGFRLQYGSQDSTEAIRAEVMILQRRDGDKRPDIRLTDPDLLSADLRERENPLAKRCCCEALVRACSFSSRGY